jgi:hypothetical protein
MAPVVEEKIIVKKENNERVISRWVKPKGYDLAICELYNYMFGVGVTVVFGKMDEAKKFVKDRTEYEIEHDNANAMFVWAKHENEDKKFLLFTENNWAAEDYGTICHELHHFTHHVIDEEIGASYGKEGEEFYAYFQGYFMGLVVLAFSELKQQLSRVENKKNGKGKGTK